MTRPIQLPTQNEIDNAQAKLAAEIERAKTSAIVADAKLDWAALRWDLTEQTERTSPASSRVVAIVAPRKTKDRYSKIWADFFLTLLVWLLEEKSEIGEKWNSSHLLQIIKSARRLFDRLIEDGTAADITRVSPAFLEDYLDECSKANNSAVLSLTLGIIARLSDHGVAPQLSGVSSKQSNRAFKGPSDAQKANWNEIVALGSAFQKLRSPESPYAARADFD